MCLGWWTKRRFFHILTFWGFHLQVKFEINKQLLVDGHNFFLLFRRKQQSEILSFFALLNILFIYLFNSNASKIGIGCACLVIWYREIPHGPSMLRYNMCSMRFRNFNLSTEKVLAFIQFSLILIERNKPRGRFILFHPCS